MSGALKPFEGMSVAEIKERAIQQARRGSRGLSALSLIRSAKGQISLARSCESAGDFKGALNAFTKAACLTQAFMDTADFKAENILGKRGVLWKEFTEFQHQEGSDLLQRAHAIESRLSQVEKSTCTQLNGHNDPPPPLENGVQRVSRGSVVDRIRALQDAGVSVSTTKRVTREIPSSLSIPLSSTTTSTSSDSTGSSSLQPLGLSSPTITHITSSSFKVSEPPPSTHSFVSPAALGPPSPTSSASSSPRTSFLTPVEFSQAFPSIDELEEIDGRRAMTDTEPRSDNSGSPANRSTPWPGSSHPPGDRSPDVGSKSFPFLPDDLSTSPSAAETLATTHSVDDKVKTQGIDIDKDKKGESHNKLVHDNPSHEPFEVTPSPLNPYEISQSLMPHSRASFSASPPSAALGLPHSIGGVVTGAEVTEPTISVTHAAPATGAIAQSPFAAFIPSRSRLPAFPERVGNQKWGGDSAIVPGNNSKRKRTNPIEQAEGYTRTRSRAIKAIGGVLGTAASIGHEALFTGVDLLQFAPVPGLDLAGKILLSTWDAVGMVETNRVASLRLIERCADILISIRGEIADAGDTIAEELSAPVEKLVKSFEEVHSCINKLGQRTFLKRYLRRNEILSNISDCNVTLNDAREAFGTSIQIRTLRLVKATELRQQDLLESLSHVSPKLPLSHSPLLPPALQSLPADPESVRSTLHALHAAQNAQDCARDMADLHKLMRAALEANDDVAMFRVFQIARSEMPEAIETLERILKRVVEDGQIDAEEGTTARLTYRKEARNVDGSPLDPGNTGASHSSADTLDRDFIVTGIEALRRLSKGADLSLPSWTITWFEVELEKQVGVGSFSDVFRGTWRKHTVAVKVLDKTTPPKIFLREVNIWKSLYHPNVLELFGASSASGDPPWFLVCKYYPQGNLVKYLKGLDHTDPTRIDAVKMVHEISNGMAYLHGQGVLHGDLKAANILVGDDTSCVISDFGQSEMKSEVYRITRAPQLRGTLRWQAPELMEGAQTLTAEMDVYAFAICCWEILNMGALPWPLMDDSAVRHFVLNQNMRPLLPPSSLVSGHLVDVICTSWDRVPSKRPSFEKIARDLKIQRAGGSSHLLGAAVADTMPPAAGKTLPKSSRTSARSPNMNVAEPRELHNYMYKNELKVLILDVRTRESFDYEHIRGDAVVCIEPSALFRDKVSGQMIEESLTVAPRDEWILFCNRDKFDLVAIYDDASETPGPPDSPLSRLERAIYETAFRKILKRMPVLLIGGLEAWKREFGERELVGRRDASL